MKMSVLIKKMEMSKGCWACPFAVGKHYECLFTKKSYNWGLTTRPSDCPLIEVQSPHGRLVDGDVLMTEVMDSDLDHLQRDDWKEVIQIVADAPTIIEAEGRE
jgi:hypothetical protein